MEQQMVSKINHCRRKQTFYGVDSILTYYHILSDLHIGLGRYEIRIIPSSCIKLRNAMGFQRYPLLMLSKKPGWFQNIQVIKLSSI